MHSCLRNALVDVGIDVSNMPEYSSEGIRIEDVPDLCTKMGLIWHGTGEVKARVGEPIVVIYQTRPGWGHAVSSTDARELGETETVVGVIRFPPKYCGISDSAKEGLLIALSNH